MSRKAWICLAVLAPVGILVISGKEPPRAILEPRMSYLDNGTIKLGIDLNRGGAITFLSPSGKDQNVVNSFDFGRQVQMSYYAGPVPFVVGDKRPADHWKHIGWNPIQTGDDFGHPSKVLEQSNDGKSLHVKCVPMQWPLDDVPGECVFESRITLDGPTARVKCWLDNKRSDETQYPARTQEMPAVYTNGPFYKLMTYTGEKPFSGGELTRIEKKPGEPGPWTSWLTTENWAALVNDDGWGLGVWQPACYRFSGGFAGDPGRGGSSDGPTGYIAPNRLEILDHDIRHEYDYTLILGKLDDIRHWIADHAERPKPPTWTFKADRRGWSYVNAEDAGWPIKGELNVRLNQPDPQVISPAFFSPAADASRLVIEAAFTTRQESVQVFWTRLDDPNFDERKSLTFPIRGDSQSRVFEMDLAASPQFKGIITGLRIDPSSNSAEGDRVRIASISLKPTKNGPVPSR